MQRETRSSEIKLVFVGILTGICLYVIPSAYSDRVFNLIRDTSKPGLVLIQQIKVWQHQSGKKPEQQSLVKQLEIKLSEKEFENRRLELQYLELSEQLQTLKQTGVPSYQSQSGERLLVPDLVEAHLLGESSIALLKEGRLLNQGKEQGVFGSSIVLKSDLPLIDLGEQQGIKAGYSLYAGKAVIGKIGKVGGWTSSLIPITSVDYRGSARIARKTDQGLQLGADGILVGMGEGKCKLLQIPPTESIQVGQDVYTGEVDHALPLSMQSTLAQPMYYGRVIEAELPRGAPYWKVIVEPAIRLSDVKQVSVLRQIVNPRRMLTN